MADDALSYREWWLDFHQIPQDKADEMWAAKVRLDRGEFRGTTPMCFVSQDVHYESPTTGRIITSRQARLEDMKASGCIEYDPEMKKDQMRRQKESDVALDLAVDHTVDKMIAELPVHKRESLVNEMAAGLTAEPIRQGA
jgi:hypothetical protein